MGTFCLCILIGDKNLGLTRSSFSFYKILFRKEIETTVWEEKGLTLPCPLIQGQKDLPSQSSAFGECVMWCGPEEWIMAHDWGTGTKVV